MFPSFTNYIIRIFYLNKPAAGEFYGLILIFLPPPCCISISSYPLSNLSKYFSKTPERTCILPEFMIYFALNKKNKRQKWPNRPQFQQNANASADAPGRRAGVRGFQAHVQWPPGARNTAFYFRNVFPRGIDNPPETYFLFSFTKK